MDQLTRLINDVYMTAESGLWQDGVTRTTGSELAELIERGEIAVATRDGRIAGMVRIHDVAGDTSEFGMLVAAPDERGSGIGRALIEFAERHSRERGMRTMQLELLVPRDWRHETKEFLKGGTAGSATGSRVPSRSTTPIRTWRRCSPPRATSPSTRSPWASADRGGPRPAAASYTAGVPSAFACQGLEKRYGDKLALGGVDLRVEPGELIGLLGPNGAGKSTLTKIACGLVRAGAGSAEVNGAPAGSAEARAGIGYLAELFRFPDWLSADELVGLHQRLGGSPGGAKERMELLSLVGLEEAADVRVGAMSKGMQQRLGIAQALVGAPRLLLLDEPTSALDPMGRRVVRDLLRELRSRGVAVLLNSHLLSEVELVCDRVAILSAGLVVAEGAPSDLTRARGLEIETASGLQSYPDATREEVPAIVAGLVGSGASVYGVRLMESTLEDAYLEVLGSPPELERHA